ncbi:MAG: helix-turn-helix domain-containing protein [Muribaculaceae bacterium]|nr:helix-turn-helix domain-containing protein [Muribaculaceae bacterium]
MSSNIRIEKTCEWCGQQFTAQTTVTRFCSKRCAEHSYKERMRQQKIQQANSAVPSKISVINEKDYLTVAETAQVLGMTRQGVYKLIYRGDLAAAKLSSRLTLIKRDSIDKMLDGSPYKKRESNEKKMINEFYTRAEIREKFGVKDSWIYKVVAENNVPKTILRGKAYFSKTHIDRLFSARKDNPEITEWYSVEDIQDKYGMTLSAIYTLVSKIGIPKRKDGPKVYYSKYHFDVAKGTKSAEDVEFISVPEAMEKYSLTRDQLYHYVKTYKITKLRCGKYVKLNAKELEALFNPEIQL